MAGKKILIMSLTRMGDMIQSTPLLAGLRRQQPDAAITLAVSSDFAEFSRRIPCVDKVIAFNLRQFNQKRGAGEQFTWVEVYRYLQNFLNEVMAEKYDQVINLSHSKLSALMISYMNIKQVNGFFCNATGDRMTHHPWLQYFGIEPFNRAFNSFNLVDIYKRSGDVTEPSKQVMLRREPEDGAVADAVLRPYDVRPDEVLIGFQVGSSLENRRWPASAFAELGDLLCAGMNARIVLFGVKSESAIAAEVAASMRFRERVIDLTGKTGIAELVPLVARCRYLVTNDTGTMHIAAAMGVRIIGLFFAHAHPYETGPYGEGHLVFQGKPSCAPCSYGVECNNIICVRTVVPRDVYRAMEAFHATGKWSLPKDFCAPDVFVGESCFDKEGLLWFKPLLRARVTEQDAVLLAYRRMWLESLEGRAGDMETITAILERDFDLTQAEQITAKLRELAAVFRELSAIGEKGAQISGKIARHARQKHAAAALRGLGDEVGRLDERVSLLGLSHPEVKPVAEIFSKRKENLCGDDIAILAVETIRCYEKLAAEGNSMAGILTRIGGYLGSRRQEETAGCSGSRIFVPGR